MEGLKNVVAVVTGGRSGIGQAIAIRLGEEGVNVAINYVGRPEGARGRRGSRSRRAGGRQGPLQRAECTPTHWSDAERRIDCNGCMDHAESHPCRASLSALDPTARSEGGPRTHYSGRLLRLGDRRHRPRGQVKVDLECAGL